MHRKSRNLLDVDGSNHADADGIDGLQIGSYAALSIHVVIISLLNFLDKKDNLLLKVMMNKIYLKSLIYNAMHNQRLIIFLRINWVINSLFSGNKILTMIPIRTVGTIKI